MFECSLLWSLEQWIGLGLVWSCLAGENTIESQLVFAVNFHDIDSDSTEK